MTKNSMLEILASGAIAMACLLRPSPVLADGCWQDMQVICQPAQRVVPYGESADICHTLDLWMSEAYAACTEGSSEAACGEASSLWKSSDCRTVRDRNSAFTVTSVDLHPPDEADALALSQISPVDDSSKTYWAAPGDFQPAR